MTQDSQMEPQFIMNGTLYLQLIPGDRFMSYAQNTTSSYVLFVDTANQCTSTN